MKYLPVLLLLIGFAMLSCEDSTSIKDDESLIVSLPLKVGNSWTYNFTYTYAESGETSEPEEITFEISSDTTVDGTQWFFLESGTHRYDQFMGGYYSNQENGVYYRSGFEDSENEKITEEISAAISRNEPFLLPKTLGPELDSDGNKKNEYLFLHHPDEFVPERLIKSDSFIGTVTYEGINSNHSLEVQVKNYTREFYQVSSGSRVYGLEPVDMNFSISNELGFTVFESFYYFTGSEDEADPRLKLYSVNRFELISYSIQ